MDVLKQAADVLLTAYVARHIKPQERIKLKVRRLDVTALIMFGLAFAWALIYNNFGA